MSDVFILSDGRVCLENTSNFVSKINSDVIGNFLHIDKSTFEKILSKNIDGRKYFRILKDNSIEYSDVKFDDSYRMDHLTRFNEYYYNIFLIKDKTGNLVIKDGKAIDQKDILQLIYPVRGIVNTKNIPEQEKKLLKGYAKIGNKLYRGDGVVFIDNGNKNQ